jgi:hypothetical protein
VERLGVERLGVEKQGVARSGEAALRGGIGEGVPIWIGGGAGAGLQLPSGVEFIKTYDEFEKKVGLLPFANKKRTPR